MTHAEYPAPCTASSSARPAVVYLDQNMWIDLARALKAPEDHPRNAELLGWLAAKVEAGTLRLPLTATNLYETHKVKNSELRSAIAFTQAKLSEAHVFRGRRRRLEIEVSRVLSRLYGLPWSEPSTDWVFSRFFFESQAEHGDASLGIRLSDGALDLVRMNPEAALFEYLVQIEDVTRQSAVDKFEQSSDRLRADIEERRDHIRNESLSVRRKIYSAILAFNDQDSLIDIAKKVGLSWSCFKDNNGATMRRVIEETPAIFIERELALKLEGQARPIHVNDIRDMRNFSTVLPYADIVVAEKHFTDLTRQAGLATRFEARLETDLAALTNLL